MRAARAASRAAGGPSGEDPRGDDLRPLTLAVDWSGDARSARKLAVATCRGTELVGVRTPASREALADELLALDEPAVVGLDFAFSFPGWFLVELGVASAPDLWALAARDGERWLAECRPPLWGRPGVGRPDLGGRAHLRATDAATGARSPFQVGGAGAVGTGSVRGMPLLHRLREAGWAVWPFDDAAPDRPLVLEVWPRTATGPVVKSSAAAREAAVAADPRVPDTLRAAVAATEDAFDAALAALQLAEHRDAVTRLRRLGPPHDLEGAIWTPS